MPSTASGRMPTAGHRAAATCTSLFSQAESLQACRYIAQTRHNFLPLSWPLLEHLLQSGLAPAGIYAVLFILRRQMIQYHRQATVGPIPVDTAQLAERCGLSERSIQREIKKAEGLGILKRQVRRSQYRSLATLMEVALPVDLRAWDDGVPEATGIQESPLPVPTPEERAQVTEKLAPRNAVRPALPPPGTRADRPRLSLLMGALRASSGQAPGDRTVAMPADKRVGQQQNQLRTVSEQNKVHPNPRTAACTPQLRRPATLSPAASDRDPRGRPGYWVSRASERRFIVAESPRFRELAAHAIRRLQGVHTFTDICELLQQFEYTLMRQDRGRPRLQSLNGLIGLVLGGQWSQPFGYSRYMA